MSSGYAKPEIDPSWWADAFVDDDLGAADWRVPELAAQRIASMDGEAAEGTLQREVLAALAIASSAMLNPESWDEPFKPMMSIGNRRSHLPGDLTESQLELLARVLPLIEQRPLKGRIADVLWFLGDRSDHELLRIAIDAYRAVPLERDVWHQRGNDEWRRAIELARRRGRAEMVRLTEMGETIRTRILGGDLYDGFMLIDLSDLLRMCVKPEDDERAKLAARYFALAAEAAENDKKFARHLERKAQEWFASIDAKEEVYESVERIAKLYEREAQQRMAAGSGNALAAGHFLEKALGTLRTLPRKYRVERNLHSRTADLRERLAESREASLEAMMRIETDPIDLTDAVANTRRRVSGRSKFDALVHLSALYPLSEVQKASEHAKELAEGSLRHLFGRATYSADGRKVAASEGSPALPEAAIWSDMVRTVAMKTGIVATGFLLPGLEVVTFEHRYDLSFLQQVCLGSPLVPPGHEDLWARGIRHGLNGDFPSAVTVLVPQIEQLVRQGLKRQGVHTLVVDEMNGVESEKGLGALLAMPEAVQLLGPDLHFELRALLVEQEGPNRRHNTAHGLLNDDQAWSAESLYVWWLCLRMVVVPLWNVDQDGRGDDEAAADEDADGRGGSASEEYTDGHHSGSPLLSTRSLEGRSAGGLPGSPGGL